MAILLKNLEMGAYCVPNWPSSQYLPQAALKFMQSSRLSVLSTGITGACDLCNSFVFV